MTVTLAMAARAASKTHMEWHGATFIHPLALAALIVLAIWMFLAPRRTAIVPFLILICFIPSAQRIVLLGADFTLLRLMALVGLMRILCRSELRPIRFNRIDGVYVAWVLVGSIVYIIQQEMMSAVMFALGTSMDMLGAYLVARALVQNIADFRSFARSLAIIAIPVACFFVSELATQRNLFAFFGGVPEITAMREGRLRCQGAYSHPILAGVFWAAVAAFTMGGALGRHARPYDRLIFAAGSIASVFVIVASASSTPLQGFLAGVVFWLWWPFRRFMRYVFIAAPFVLVCLHLVMKGPVWSLVARVSAVGGSTGHHRFVLIDGAIRHFHEWWLVGSTWTGHWEEFYQTWDITNQYVLEGVRGGVARLGLFMALIYIVGRAIAKAQGCATNKADRLLLWGFAASLFVHCVCFIGVSYFGQISYLWYMSLALGASMASPAFFPRARPYSSGPEINPKGGTRANDHPPPGPSRSAVPALLSKTRPSAGPHAPSAARGLAEEQRTPGDAIGHPRGIHEAPD